MGGVKVLGGGAYFLHRRWTCFECVVSGLRFFFRWGISSSASASYCYSRVRIRVGAFGGLSSLGGQRYPGQTSSSAYYYYTVSNKNVCILSVNVMLFRIKLWA